MKTSFLVVFFILNLKNILQAAPQSELVDEQIYIQNEDCAANYQKLLSELKTTNEMIRNIPTSSMKPETNDVNIMELKNDLKTLNEKFNTFMEKSLRKSSNEELVDLIKSNNNFLDTKVFALSFDVKELVKKFDELPEKVPRIETVEMNEVQATKFNQIIENARKMLEKLSEEQPKLTHFIETNVNVIKQFELFGENVSKLINDKFEQQEKEIRNLKAQNERNFQQLKQINELLSNQRPSSEEYAKKIENLALEKHEILTNNLKYLNETLIKHFDEHAAKFDAHESLLKAIKDGSSDNTSSQLDTNKRLLETLIKRFDEAEPLWKKVETSAENDKNCNDLPDLDINLLIVDGDYD